MFRASTFGSTEDTCEYLTEENPIDIQNSFRDWMIKAMSYWLSHPTHQNIPIRVFHDVLQASYTRKPKTDWFGARNVSYIIVETDGSYDILGYSAQIS